jgi:riboflavin kinase / FMN adenylyltransferase
MRLIRGLKHLKSLHHNGCVLTIGNFDGVHLGHQTVIRKLAEQGVKLGLPVVVMVFEPQPLEFFLHHNAPSRLTRLREKIIHLVDLPVDELLIARFDQKFADIDPERFIKEILVDALNVKYLVIGDDFHFGKARRGNFAMLKEKGAQYGFQVADTLSFQVAEQRVSSTIIRDALVQGNLSKAAQLLGRPYSVCGRVIHGAKRGRAIGFPTANIQMQRKNTPIEGVFAVTMTGVHDMELAGVANVGTRPTIDSETNVLLEVHLFNFSTEIYGHYVEVHFKQKIRSEIRFHSVDGLKAQIKLDVAEAKNILAL